jgi:hypothetical protein
MLWNHRDMIPSAIDLSFLLASVFGPFQGRVTLGGEVPKGGIKIKVETRAKHLGGGDTLSPSARCLL